MRLRNRAPLRARRSTFEQLEHRTLLTVAPAPALASSAFISPHASLEVASLAPLVERATQEDILDASRGNVVSLAGAHSLQSTAIIATTAGSFDVVVLGNPSDADLSAAAEEWLEEQETAAEILSISRGHTLRYVGRDAPLQSLLALLNGGDGNKIVEYETGAAYLAALADDETLVLELDADSETASAFDTRQESWAIKRQAIQASGALKQLGQQAAVRRWLREQAKQDGPQIQTTEFITGPDTAVRGQPLTYTLEGPLPAPATFTFEIDWNNDDIVDQSLTAVSGTTVAHTFTDFARDANNQIIPTGFDIQVEVTDGTGPVGTSSHRTTVLVYDLQPDTANPSLNNLVVGMSEGDDLLGFTDGLTASDVIVLGSSNGVDFDLQETVSNVTGRVIVYAQSGDDLVAAVTLSQKSVEIYAGYGNDGVIGSGLADSIYGGQGNDTIGGSMGADFLFGEDGDDIVFGGILEQGADAGDTILGGDGSDFLLGEEGNDVIEGGVGDDYLVGMSDNDTLVGGIGDDLYLYSDLAQGADKIIEPADVDLDVLDFRSYPGAVHFDLSSTGVQQLTPGDSSTSIQILDPGPTQPPSSTAIEIIAGSPYADSLQGGARNDWLLGGEGDDTILGGEGDDIVLGSLFVDDESYQPLDGNDLLDGGPGDDSIGGMSGNDTLLGGAGNDYMLGEGLLEFEDVVSGSDQIYGGDGDDYIAGFEGADTIEGGDGDDAIFGWYDDFEVEQSLTDSADIIDSGTGDDRVWGGAGDDQIFGGPGVDALFGGPGADTLGGGAGRNLLVGGTGADSLAGGDDEDIVAGDDVSFWANEVAIADVLDEWLDAGEYVSRVSHLSGETGGQNGTTFLSAATIVVDNVSDSLLGADGRDWYPDAQLGNSLGDAVAGEVQRPNTRPTWSGSSSVNATTGTTQSVLNLLNNLSDSEDSDATLALEVISNSNPGMLPSASIDPATGQLTVAYATNAGSAGLASGQIVLSATDPDGFGTQVILTLFYGPPNNSPPIIHEFFAWQVDAYFAIVDGHVIDEYPGGLTIHFGSLLEGFTTTTTPGGWFTLVVPMDLHEDWEGTITAWTFDPQGLQSNLIIRGITGWI